MVYLTRTLAEHISHSLSGNMPPAVREIALRCVLDLLAAAFAGLHMPGPSAMRKVASQLFGEGEPGLGYGENCSSGGRTALKYSGRLCARSRRRKSRSARASRRLCHPNGPAHGRAVAGYRR
jgi:hypothetical protein